jgi:hypothetical protein
VSIVMGAACAVDGGAASVGVMGRGGERDLEERARDGPAIADGAEGPLGRGAVRMVRIAKVAGRAGGSI